MNYGQPPAHTQPQAAIPAQHEQGGAQPPGQPQQPRREGGGGGGGGRGAIIGAAVAILLVVGVIAAVLLTQDGDDKDKKATPTPSGGQSSVAQSPSSAPTQAPSTAPGGKIAVLEAEDAAPSNGAVAAPGVPNSTGTGLVNMEASGASVTMKFTAPKAGTYYLAMRYLNPAVKDDVQTLSILVNGTDTKKKANLKSFGIANSVSGTWNNVTLTEGANEVVLACAAGDKCKAMLDQIWVSDQKPDFNKKD
ncbi:hypothetical protein [Embleya sp. NBC_00896]|uniref:hypothetical protein n=1 Tax=Embleya sp. NBC_00896 TaxID=2975961 RepID=UPI00386B16C4|nr:hypothetical protein OG928_14920 [Embleya sp. NBC_00896]